MEKNKNLLWNGKKLDVGAHVAYITDGKGKWYKRISAKRCVDQVFLNNQCQGVHGHAGFHWCYDADGSFCWDDNEYDPQKGGYSGSTPPDHEEYVSPVEMFKYHYSRDSGEYIEVTEPEIILKLEKNELFEEGIQQVVMRPVTDPNWINFFKKIKNRRVKNEKTTVKFMEGEQRPKDD